MNERQTSPAHDPGTSKAEEMKREDGQEPGRQDTGATGADRPTGASTARMSTGINAGDRNPIDPDSPNLPTP